MRMAGNAFIPPPPVYHLHILNKVFLCTVPRQLTGQQATHKNAPTDYITR